MYCVGCKARPTQSHNDFITVNIVNRTEAGSAHLHSLTAQGVWTLLWASALGQGQREGWTIGPPDGGRWQSLIKVKMPHNALLRGPWSPRFNGLITVNPQAWCMGVKHQQSTYEQGNLAAKEYFGAIRPGNWGLKKLLYSQTPLSMYSGITLLSHWSSLELGSPEEFWVPFLLHPLTVRCPCVTYSVYQ